MTSLSAENRALIERVLGLPDQYPQGERELNRLLNAARAAPTQAHPMTSQQPPEGLSAENRALIETALDCYARAMWDANRHIGGSDMDRLLNAARSTPPAPDPKAGEREQVAEAVERSVLERGGYTGKADITQALMGPHEWGYRCVAEGHFIDDGAPFAAAELISHLRGALAEARSEVERLKQREHRLNEVSAMPIGKTLDLKDRAEAAETALAEARSDVERVTTDLGWANLRRQEAIDRYMVAEARAEAALAEMGADATTLDTFISASYRHAKRADEAEYERDTLAAQLVGAREALEEIARRIPGLGYEGVGEIARQALSMSILRGDKGCSLGAIEAPSCGSPADSQPSGGAE